MSKIRWGLTVLLVAGLGIGAVYAVGVNPGSQQDPVVTKSYVDNQISSLKNMQQGATTYQVVQVQRGKMIIGSAGTEMVLRSGDAVIVDNTRVNGVSDLTAGITLLNGNNVISNHQLLIPRADGRGLKATTDTFILVRGAYEIK